MLANAACPVSHSVSSLMVYVFHESTFLQLGVYALLTKLVRSRWLDIEQVLLFASLWTLTLSRSIKTQKKRSQHPAILTEQAWLINSLLYGQKITPRFQKQSEPGSQSEHRIRFIFPARGASHIIRILAVTEPGQANPPRFH